MPSSLTPAELATLAEKWLNGTITPAEEQRFNEWYEQTPDAHMVVASGDEDLDAFRERVLTQIKATLEAGEHPIGKLVVMEDRPTRRRTVQVRWIRWIAAASVVVMLGMGGYALYRLHGGTGYAGDATALVSNGDVTPGKDAAILTLSGGKTVVLDSGAQVLPTQGTAAVHNIAGQLAYTASGTSQADIVYNTLRTGRGNQYQLVLSDGTKVWLNAGSSIQYPVTFSGDTRTVMVTGEAYFEVIHQDKAPFIVQVGDRAIVDLGTHFNVNAYTDEPAMTTTLLEGSVKVGDVVLRPGQQASLGAQGQVRVKQDADVDLAVAWKNGMQSYSSADLKTVMRQIARWYDIDIAYRGKIPDRTFSGDIPRSANLSEVLKLFDATHIHFVMDNVHRQLTLLP